MFNDHYGLTEAVLEGRKTMTRRIEVNDQGDSISEIGKDGRPMITICPWANYRDVFHTSYYPKYKVGDVVAIAQSYKDIYFQIPDVIRDKNIDHIMHASGWKNKMFARANFMPHHIKITDIKVERLQDISDADCLREGIYPVKSEDVPQINETGAIYYTFGGVTGIWTTPRAAFAALIDKVGKKGTWASNPWVFCYSFKLVD